MYDLIIIGMGPSGMSAGLYAKRSNLNVLILESNAPGGTLLKVKNIDNYLGFSNTSGTDLALSMFNHIQDLGIEYKIENVLKIENKKEYKEIITNKEKYKTKTILITSGKSINKLIINNENIIADNISYCVLCDGALYKDKNVVLIEETSDDTEKLYLDNIAKCLKVLKKEEIKDINIENNLVKEIKTNDETIKTDGVFVASGDNIATEFDKDLDIRENGKIKINDKYETKVEGIYASGDVIKKDICQVCNAVSEGAEAVISIIKYLGVNKR